jgi:predicted porin
MRLVARGVFASRFVLRIGLLLVAAALLLPGRAHAQQVTAAATSQPPPSPQQVVTCSSKVGERQVCPADTLAGVALLRSTGTATCLLGKTWGYDDKGVWVFDGCGGEFALGSTHEASGGNSFLGTFEPYGQWRTHVAAFDDTAEVQDNATRVGINFRTRGDVQMFVGTEWGVNFVQSSTQFNLSAAGPGEFGEVTTTSSSPFIARLGFVGIDFGPAGRVAIGKQWSTHYDVTSYTTDRFNVFGGQGTSTYVAGTDGGVTGTGRADRVVTYRNKVAKILDVGLQAQFRGTEKNGVGGSAQVTLMPGVKVGAAFTHTNFPQATRDGVQGLDVNADYAALGTRIDWKYLEVGFVYTHHTSGDMVQVPFGDTTRNVAFNADGTELFVRARGGPIAVIGGYTQLSPKDRDPLLNPEFKTSYVILGGEWLVTQRAKLYTESKLDLDTVSATGAPAGSVFTIGFRYDFSWKISHK